ncbi:lipopolysaccharide biosynthesis protein [Sphingomonas sp.]|uniref:lipopolysaccharide biosynthesis protein n=1 Tax=Sphingomonas sp. TaxID=28214 RepID=UPI003CC535BB
MGGQSVWAVAEYIAYPLMMFAATPFLLRGLGSAQYGQYLLLLTFNGFGGIAGLGMGTAVVKEVSEARGRGDAEGAGAGVRSGLAVTLVATALLCMVLLAVGVVLGPNLLKRMGPPDTIRMLFVGAATLIALEQVDLVFASTLRGAERFDLSARIELASKSAIVATAVAAAWVWSSLSSVVVTTVTLTAVRCLAKGIIATKFLRQGWLIPRWDPPVVRRIFSFGVWTWGQAVGSALFGMADRLLIGGMLGADPLARYSVCLQLAQQITAVPAAAAQVLLPKVSRADAEGSDTIGGMAAKAMLILTTAAGIAALCLIIFGHWILWLWVGGDFAATGTPILTVLAIAFAVLAINNVPHFVLLGLRRSRTVALVNISAGIIGLLVTWVAIRHWGLSAAAFGRLAYAIVICLLARQMFSELRARGSSSPTFGEQ